MKAYRVIMGHGEYEEYREYSKYFTNKGKAEYFAKEYDELLNLEKQKIEKCNNCKHKELEKDIYSLISVFPKCYDKEEFYISFCCKNRILDAYKCFADIEEIEIEE